MKKSDNDSNAPSDKRQYKKKYILRVYEEQEAKEEIQQYEDSETGSDPNQLDGGRSERSGGSPGFV